MSRDFQRSFDTLHGNDPERNLIERVGEHIGKQIAPSLPEFLSPQLVAFWNDDNVERSYNPSNHAYKTYIGTYLELAGLGWDTNQVFLRHIEKDFHYRGNNLIFFTTLGSLAYLNKLRKNQSTERLLLLNEEELSKEEQDRIKFITGQIKPEDPNVISEFTNQAISAFVLRRGILNQTVNIHTPDIPEDTTKSQRLKILLTRMVSSIISSFEASNSLEWGINKSDRFRISLLSRFLRSSVFSALETAYPNRMSTFRNRRGLTEMKMFVEGITSNISEPYPPKGKAFISDATIIKMLFNALNGETLHAPEEDSPERKFWDRLDDIAGDGTSESVRIGNTVIALAEKARILGIDPQRILQMQKNLLLTGDNNANPDDEV
jgi:hypothetical protein